MGYRGFSNDELRDVIAEWDRDAPAPGSRGERAQQKARAELERRRTARSAPRQ